MRHYQKTRKRWQFSPRTYKRLLLWGSGVFGVFILANLVLWGVYHSRTYPGTKIMNTTVGSVAYSDLAAKASALHILPEKVTLSHGRQEQQVSLADLGISADIQRTVTSANSERSWLPVLNFFSPPELKAPIAVNNQKFSSQNTALSKTLRQNASDARLTLDGTTVGIASASDGYELNTTALKTAVTDGLDHARVIIAIPVTITHPKVQASDLKDKKSDLEAQLKTSITYTYNGKSKKLSASEIAAWYAADEHGDYTPVAGKVQGFVTETASGFGIRPKNSSQLAASTIQALAKHQAYSGAIEQQIALRTFTYCTAVKGVDAGNLAALRSKAAESFASSKGWSVGGLVEFKEVSSGCDFTIWLTASNLMPSFGEICDAMWSCRIGPNVVINFDRWQNASPTWNAAGLSLDTYRNLAINHETGHWLGFEHSGCPGAGQPAPVMEQQSIDLQGCTFNAWPTATEIATLRRTLGI